MKRSVIIVVFLMLCIVAFADFVEIAPGGKYFEHKDKSLIPLGFNDALPWPSLSPLLMGDIKAGERYFEKLKEYGVNVLRIMFEYSQDKNNLTAFEDPLGERNPIVIETWDRIVNLAEKYDIYLIITPWDPFWGYENWETNPYNIKNEGTISSLKYFLTDEKTIENAKNRFKFMIDRYGDSDKILAWELNNEIELWYGRIFNKPDSVIAREVKNWIKEMSSYIREYEMKKFGQTHLITVSTAAPALTGTLANILYDQTYLDFVTTHFYYDTIKQYTEPLKIAEDVTMNIRYHNYIFNDSVPFMDSESGPINNWPLRADLDVKSYKAFSWSHIASGGTGIGLRWPYTIPHKMPSYLLDVIKAVRAFVEDNINWLYFKGVNLDDFTKIKCSADEYFFTNSGNSVIETTQIIGWVCSNGKELGNVSITFEDLHDGVFSFEAWDTDEGTIFYTNEYESNEGEITVQLETDKVDFAIKLYKKDE
jgi:mannan endo-1,4-beta-mannosidase